MTLALIQQLWGIIKNVYIFLFSKVGLNLSLLALVVYPFIAYKYDLPKVYLIIIIPMILTVIFYEIIFVLKTLSPIFYEQDLSSELTQILNEYEYKGFYLYEPKIKAYFQKGPRNKLKVFVKDLNKHITPNQILTHLLGHSKYSSKSANSIKLGAFEIYRQDISIVNQSILKATQESTWANKAKSYCLWSWHGVFCIFIISLVLNTISEPNSIPKIERKIASIIEPIGSIQPSQLPEKISTDWNKPLAPIENTTNAIEWYSNSLITNIKDAGNYLLKYLVFYPYKLGKQSSEYIAALLKE